MIPDSFSLLEPYWAFSQDVDAPKYRDLLSCRIFEDRALARQVMWNYECINDRTLDRLAPAFAQRCLRHKLTEQDIVHLKMMCHAAPVRIVKTIRFGNHHNFDWVHEKRVRLMYLARHPWSLLRSQFELGWHRETGTDLYGFEAAILAANRTCSQIVNAYEVIQFFEKNKNFTYAKLAFEHFVVRKERAGERERWMRMRVFHDLFWFAKS